MQQISASQLAEWLNDPHRTPPSLIDVREPDEFAYCHIPGAINMPLSDFMRHAESLDQDATLVMICHHGMRSYQAGAWLERQGFDEVINLSGGVEAWSVTVDPTMPRY
ncbi:sulfurtransferase [Burkholderiaceae bacterium DAT-1]|nr:sulfurtransferase [Burkholderiaceae bacterium DAT-1]